MTQPLSDRFLPPSPPSPARHPSASAGHATARPPQGGAKETIEQILVAFILAFIFRCFIVEAFVIPTGSMAPTLLGAHMNFRCGDCGYHFSVNYSVGAGGIDSPARETYPARCPNCGYKLPLTAPTDPANDAAAAEVQYGDRILVQKYIYLLHEPKRWDVVVFKNPDQPSEGSERYQDNYIKRLTGLPGETLFVLDGDLYTSSSTAPISDLKPTDFTVQTKTHEAQEALWRVVYDNDYLPRGLSRTYTIPSVVSDPSSAGGSRVIERPFSVEQPWRQPWRPDANGWDVSGQSFKFDGLGTSAALHYDLTSMPEKYPLTDWLAYDVSYRVARGSAGTSGFELPGYRRGGESPVNDVSDVKLALTYRRTAGDGDLRLSTTKQGHTFAAVIGKGDVRLEMRKPGSEASTVIGTYPASVGIDRSSRIELINADYRVSIRIDGKEVLASTPADFAPDIAKLLADFENRHSQDPARVRIDAANQTCEIKHVSLWRDVYYLNINSIGGLHWGIPSNFPNGDHNGHLMRLEADEFWVLGDNSFLSGDARCWQSAVTLSAENLAAEAGRVPRRFMLGRAFFVYWPAGFAPIPSLPAFVPNFGEMRFIH